MYNAKIIINVTNISPENMSFKTTTWVDLFS